MSKWRNAPPASASWVETQSHTFFSWSILRHALCFRARETNPARALDRGAVAYREEYAASFKDHAALNAPQQRLFTSIDGGYRRDSGIAFHLGPFPRFIGHAPT